MCSGSNHLTKDEEDACNRSSRPPTPPRDCGTPAQRKPVRTRPWRAFPPHHGHSERSPVHHRRQLNPPGTIDIGTELHQTPADIFNDAPTPLLAQFSFRRDVPAWEKKPPATLA